MAKGNAIIGQSGGPTSVINSSLAGVIEQAKKTRSIANVYGMHFAIEGFMEGDVIDLGKESKATVKGLKCTPGSALGSCRHKVKEPDLPRILENLKKFDIRYMFLIGGNDTMDTIHRVEKYARENGYEMFGVGIPKTVDNDLFGTDHTPGYPSAARYTALSVYYAGILARDMERVDQFVVYQSIGRDAGWLTAAAALAKTKDPAERSAHPPAARGALQARPLPRKGQGNLRQVRLGLRRLRRRHQVRGRNARLGLRGPRQVRQYRARRHGRHVRGLQRPQAHLQGIPAGAASSR